jgi:hypothetical protein
MVFTTWALKRYRDAYRKTNIIVILLTPVSRYQGEIQTSEEFSTAGRTVKSGLVAAAVVSSWTWAATLLQQVNASDAQRTTTNAT